VSTTDLPTTKLAPADHHDETLGQILGRYKLLEKVGEGGFGVVYVAEQKEPVKRRVALKIIKLGMDTRQVVARFEAERQALALMDHPNIAKVLDAGATESGRPYFVMELVRGVRITDYCDQHKLSTKQRLELFILVCQAIQHAHQKGIIHRDIKPSNILVTLHDGVPVPKVIDFGIAKATQQELTEKTVYTQLQQFVGTPAYMSPEQAEMSGLDIDTRSDIYSLGVLLYELLTGSTPFDTKELLRSGLDEMRKIIREREPNSADYFISALLFRGGRVAEALNSARPAARWASEHASAAMSWGGMNWGGLASALAIWEAQMSHRPEAEQALQMARNSLEIFAKGADMSPHYRTLAEEPIRDAERRTKHGFGEDATVLGLARDTLVRIDELTKGETYIDRKAVLNQMKRNALSDAASAALNLHRFTEAELSARALLAMPLMHGTWRDEMVVAEPDDLGWARVLLAQAQVGLGQRSEALKTLEPALALYREMQLQGVTHVTFVQHFARALYVQALAESTDPDGTTRRRAALDEALKLLQGLTEEAKQLHDSKELLSWIAAEEKETNQAAEIKKSAGAAPP
jgi:tRNA A-37 threonylcarbamoyl transferase component Bud32